MFCICKHASTMRLSSDPVEKSQTFAVKMLTNTFTLREREEAVEILKKRKKIFCQVSMHARTPGLGVLPHLLSKYSGLKRTAGPKYIRQQRCKWVHMRCCFKSRSDSDTILSFSSALYLWWSWWVWCPLLPLRSLQTQCWFHSDLVQTPSPAASPRRHGI